MSASRVELHCVVQSRRTGQWHDVILKVVGDLNGLPIIPKAILFGSTWIYDLTNRRILKNKTKNAVVPCLDAEIVGDTWLSDHRFTVSI